MYRRLGDIIFEGFLVTVIIGIASLYVGHFLINNIGGSDGTYIGYVTATEKNNNLLFDSQLVYLKTDLSSSNEDQFCFTDSIHDQLLEANKKKQRVELHFANPLITWRSQCNGGVSIIDSVNPIK